MGWLQRHRDRNSAKWSGKNLLGRKNFFSHYGRNALKAAPVGTAAGVGEVKISALIIGFVAACAIVPARAEDLTAGKTPAQLFRSDCGACHRSPNGLVRERGDVSGVAAFLREHYTTNTESAAALAAYVSGLASPGGSARSRGERRRSEGDTPVAAVPVDPKPAVDRPARRRHDASQPADDSKVPRPPRELATAPRRPSGLDSESASAQAARTGAPKARKRRGGTDETATNPPAATRTNAEAPPAADAEPKPEAGAPAETSPQGEPQ
jgi:hypothetical protein